MPPDPETPFATQSSAARAASNERAELLRTRPGPTSHKPQCMVIGHAWSPDEREGWLICVACDAVLKH